MRSMMLRAVLVPSLALACVAGGCAEKEVDDRPAAPERPVIDEPEVPLAVEADPDPEATLSRPVEGVVTGPDGRPERGVKVSLFRLTSPWPEAKRQILETVTTGPTGSFRFGTERGPDLLVEAEHVRFAKTSLLVPTEGPGLDLEMPRGFSVSGIVLDRNGQPVPNADVFLEPSNWDMRRAQSIETDSGGRFRFTGVKAGVVRLKARHPLYQPAVLPSVIVGARGSSEARGFDFGGRRGRGWRRGRGGHTLRVVENSLVLVGEVSTTDDPPRPIAGAVVMALPNTWLRGLYVPTEAVTDESGKFQLEGLGPGNLRVEVRHPEYSTTGRLVALRSPTLPLSIEMGPRSRVFGRLTAGEEPLPEGVTLLLQNTASEQGRTPVAPDGTFELPGTFSAGPALLEIDGGVMAFTRTASRDVGITVEESASTELNLDVIPPSIVEGLVRNADGDPVKGAMIFIGRQHQKLPAPDKLVAVSDDQGQYRIQGLPMGSINVRVDHRDFADRALSIEVPSPGEVLRAPDIVLLTGGRIVGRVTREARDAQRPRPPRPLPGALVTANVGSGFEVVAVSQPPNGEFVLQDLAPGSYRVRARYFSLPVAIGQGALTVEAGETTGPVELRFSAGRTISGTVVDLDGEPMGNAAVTVAGTGGAVTYTDSSGSFQLEAPRREVELQAYSEDFSVRTSQTAPLGEDQVQLQLETVPSGSVTAKVRGLPGNRAITGGILRVTPLPELDGTPPPSYARPIRSRWIEMSDSVLRLPTYPAGRSRLMLQSHGYGPLVQEVDVAPGGALDLGQILLEPGNTVRCRVVDSEGNPVRGATAFLGDEVDWNAFETQIPETVSDAEGRFELRGVTPYSRTLSVYAPSHAMTTVELSIPQDILRQEPLTIDLQRGSVIAVEVEDRDGNPWEMSAVLLSLEGSIIAQAFTDDEGRVLFEHRAKGSYEVLLFGSQDVSQRVVVEETDRVYTVSLKGN